MEDSEAFGKVTQQEDLAQLFERPNKTLFSFRKMYFDGRDFLKILLNLKNLTKENDALQPKMSYWIRALSKVVLESFNLNLLFRKKASLETLKLKV